MAAQVEELERVGRLRRFLSPQLADLIVSSGDESFLESHRRDITVVFCDLRGFTTFAETTEPEEVMEVLGEYHAALGELIFRFEGTLERFAGDGLMVFFNDPRAVRRRGRRGPCGWPSPCGAGPRAWRRTGPVAGPTSALSIGIAQGYATLGRIGFEGRFDYAAIGTVTNLAARLCSEAEPWQILVTQRVQAAAEHIVVSESLGELDAPRLLEAGRGRTTSAGLNAAVTRDDLDRRQLATLAALGEDERYERFEQLQERLPDVWQIMRLNLEDESVVIIPSVTVDRVGERSGTLVQAYEERFLFLLLLLRQPRLRLDLRDLDARVAR